MIDPKLKLEAFLHRELDGTFSMYLCRGAGKYTRTLAERKKLSRKNRVCPDCVKADENQTLGEIDAQLVRGNS